MTSDAELCQGLDEFLEYGDMTSAQFVPFAHFVAVPPFR